MRSRIRKFIRERFPLVSFYVEATLSARTVRKESREIKGAISRILSRKSPIFLELGAGDKKGVGEWVTIDLTKNCDIPWDLTKGLPFPNETISKIYSSHCFEHFSFQEAQCILDECLRVLIPGGMFSICVPNARLYIEAYVNSVDLDEQLYFAWAPAFNRTTKIDYVNYTAYMDGQHKYMFDEENLLHILKLRGFRNVHLREFDSKLDLKGRDFESIYAEAQK